eukprot:CAMPEP_0168536418 /NCGR_PEP_ID=MMETSP0405-20121227/19539_1 /TAXON_ID=498012 /ORGANISM="Trichosphaerium sp, Strain Am-I-7 wt" /LENGTH=261 /DNA_ID=CAMNT_0008564423 /DNA_START=230 /DNA_END=1015 /DNA_ORIENTATION=-
MVARSCGNHAIAEIIEQFQAPQQHEARDLDPFDNDMELDQQDDGITEYLCFENSVYSTTVMSDDMEVETNQWSIENVQDAIQYFPLETRVWIYLMMLSQSRNIKKNEYRAKALGGNRKAIIIHLPTNNASEYECNIIKKTKRKTEYNFKFNCGNPSKDAPISHLKIKQSSSPIAGGWVEYSLIMAFARAGTYFASIQHVNSKQEICNMFIKVHAYNSDYKKGHEDIVRYCESEEALTKEKHSCEERTQRRKKAHASSTLVE